jgi:hypothetical protein
VFFLGNPALNLDPYFVYHGISVLASVDGPQGMFYVQAGKSYSFDNVYPQADSWLPIKADGVPLAQFVSDIEGNLSTYQ